MDDTPLVIPSMLPGECLPGWVGRFCAANVQDNSRAFITRVRGYFKKELRDTASAFSTSTLLTKLTGISSKTLLYEHSLEPWNTCCDPLTSFDLEGGPERDPWSVRFARAAHCPDCIESDQGKSGWSYWHIAHQITGVCYCYKHGTRLGFSSANHFVSLSPSLAARQGDIATTHSSFVQRVSEISVHMMHARLGHTPDQVRKNLRELLFNKSGTTDHELAEYFLGCSIEKQIPENWLQHVFPMGMRTNRLLKRLRLPTYRPVEPLIVAILLALLCESVEEARNFWADGKRGAAIDFLTPENCFET